MPMQATQRAGSAFWILRPLALQCCTGLTRSQQVPGWPRVRRQLCAGDQTAPMVPVSRPCHCLNVLSRPTETLRSISPLAQQLQRAQTLHTCAALRRAAAPPSPAADANLGRVIETELSAEAEKSYLSVRETSAVCV